MTTITNETQTRGGSNYGGVIGGGYGVPNEEPPMRKNTNDRPMQSHTRPPMQSEVVVPPSQGRYPNLNRRGAANAHQMQVVRHLNIVISQNAQRDGDRDKRYANGRRALSKFISALRDAKNWERHKGKDSDDDGIETKFQKSGENCVPISCSTMKLNGKVEPKSFAKQFRYDMSKNSDDDHAIVAFYDVKGKVVVHSDVVSNELIRELQFQVKVNSYSCIASDRDFYVQESGWIVLPDGTVLDYQDFEDNISKYPEYSMIYLLTSIDKENEYPPMKGHTRGFMYRTGICVKTDKNTSTISVIMEFDIGGNGLVKYFGNTPATANQESRAVCRKVKTMLSALKKSQ